MTSGRSFQKSSQSVCGMLFVGLVVVSLLIAWLPVQMRPVLFLAVIPAITALAISKTDEIELLSNIIIVGFVLVAFNYAARALSQLLIDPHNYTPPWQ